MSKNRGKDFEVVIKESFTKVPGVSLDRMHDQMNGFKGSQNICDFIVYKEPYEYYIECKSVHGAYLSISSNDPKKKYGNISNTQWEGMLDKSRIPGVHAGVICWWVDHDVTAFIPIQELHRQRLLGKKSIRFDDGLYTDMEFYPLAGKKKRVFFNYDMALFFKEFENV